MKKKINLVEELTLKMQTDGTFDFRAAFSSMNNLEEVDRDGRTLLVNAAFYGRNDLVTALLLLEANVHAADNNGFTALHAAVQEGYLEIVNTLLTQGANVNAQNAFGNNVIWITKPNQPIELRRLLLEHGADPTIKNSFGISAADKAAAYPEISALYREFGF